MAGIKTCKGNAFDGEARLSRLSKPKSFSTRICKAKAEISLDAFDFHSVDTNKSCDLLFCLKHSKIIIMATEKKLLEVGDKIAERGNHGLISIMTVSRVTNTQALVKIREGYEKKFKREYYDSWINEVGGQSYSSFSYRIAKESDLVELKAKRMGDKIKATDWAKLPFETLEQVYHLVYQPVSNQ